MNLSFIFQQTNQDKRIKTEIISFACPYSFVCCALCWSLVFAVPAVAVAKEPVIPVGVAKIDITPDYPIRLCGYAARKQESQDLVSHLWAKALAIGSDKDGPALFLPGEVVVDYSLRLKKEFNRLWINAYANDVPCYIPSERILKEGSYEGGGAMVYYDRPNRFAPGIEALIVNAVHDLLPKSFLGSK